MRNKMDKKFYGFSIPFVTKAVLNKSSNGCKISGTAYYIYDKDLDYKIIKQFIQVSEVEFRPTDKEMIKPTKYYKKNSESFKKIRHGILEEYQASKGLDKNKISKENKETNRLKIEDQNIINKINNCLLSANKVKDSISFFTGSNPSGAEQNNRASNEIIYYPKSCDQSFKNFNGYNFTNPFNRNEIYKINKNIHINSVKNIELISLLDYLELNPKAKELLDDYNYTKYYLLNNDFDLNILTFEELQVFNSKLEKQIFSNNSKVKSDKIKEEITELINNYKSQDLEERDLKENLNKLENSLRKYQKALLNIELKEIIDLPKNKGIENKNNIINSCEKDSFFCYEVAHIVPVKLSKQSEKTMWEIADPNNCLLLSPNTHKAYDLKYIYFNEEGNCYYLSDNRRYEVPNIKQEWLKPERKLYLKKSYQERMNDKTKH
ncbi:HNH endonuclease [Malacoplasma penetrans]|nr:HNH endonuclease [Malacoplasma penetrans]